MFRSHWHRRAALAALAMITAAAMPAAAIPFRAAIAQLVGPMELPQLRVGFDFGQEFSQIESVSLELVASVTAFEYDYCGTVFSPQACEHRTVQSSVFAILNDDPFPFFFLTGVGENGFTETPSLQRGTFHGPRFTTLPSDPFAFLGSGKGSFEIHWNSLGFFPEDIVVNAVRSTGTIFEAYIVFDATPIPEPSTSVLTALGLVLLASTRRVTPAAGQS